MHTVSFAYPDYPDLELRKKAYAFMHGVANMLPCVRCKMEWTEYLNERLINPESDNLKSKEAFSRFLVDGHNFVNKRLGKPIMSYDDVVKLYTKQSVSTFGMCSAIGKYIVYFVVLFVVIKFMFRKSQIRAFYH